MSGLFSGKTQPGLVWLGSVSRNERSARGTASGSTRSSTSAARSATTSSAASACTTTGASTASGPTTAAGSTATDTGSSSTDTCSAASRSDSDCGTTGGTASDHRISAERKQDALLGLHAADDGLNGNITLSQPCGNDEIDLVQAGARQSYKARLDQDFVDVQVEGTVNGRRTREQRSRRNMGSGGAESDPENHYRVAGVSTNRAIAEAVSGGSENVVRSASKRPGAVGPEDNCGDMGAVEKVEGGRKLAQGDR
jgi:hypothetical protein